MWQHEDGVGHEPRKADARGAYLDDARLADLAESYPAAFGEPEGAQQLAAPAVDVRGVQRARGTGGQGGQGNRSRQCVRSLDVHVMDIRLSESYIGDATTGRPVQCCVMGKPPVEATLTWRRDLTFDATAGPHTVRLDSDNHAGISPMYALAVALAGCMAVDVVMILQKGRHELTGLDVRIRGVRADGPPSYFTDVALHYDLVGEVPSAAVERAIALSRDKYCSVLHTLRPDLRLDITHAITPA